MWLNHDFYLTIFIGNLAKCPVDSEWLEFQVKITLLQGRESNQYTNQILTLLTNWFCEM